MEEDQVKNKRGITLIALVVTIVVILILAGITIQTAIGDGGLIDFANQSKEEQLIASYKDRIGIVGINWSLNRALDDSVTVDDLWQDMQDAKIINNKETDVEKVDENGNYIITVPEGYKFQIHINEYDDVEIDYIGKEDKLLPYIDEIKVINQTSNSVELQVSVSRLNNGTLNYYYKEKDAPDEDYQLVKGNTTDLTATITGLNNKTTYEIKVEATNENGTTEKETEVLIGDLKGTVTQKGETVWSNGTATVELETTETGVTIQYQIDGIEGQWLDYKGPITGLNHGQTVYALITDGTNQSGHTSIDILDEIAPTVTVTQESKNTNSIQVSVSSSDAEWGMPDSVTYNYYIKQTSVGSYPTDPTHTGTETSYTFTGLIQNTSYDVKVTTSDKAGNPGEGQVTNITTDTVGGAGDDLKEGNIIASEPTWSNGSASITLSKGTEVASSLTIQYQVGDVAEENWTTAQEGAASVTVTGLKHNDIVYARLTDGTNYGSYASVTILDKLPPQNAKIELSGQSTTTTGSITATITHTDNESGIELSKCKWIYNTKQNPIGIKENSYTNTFSNSQPIALSATTPGTYYLHVLTVDKAGNKIESISQGITVTQLVTGITVSPTSVTLEEGKTQQLTANIMPSNATNKTVSWSSNNANVATVSNTGLVTAKAAGKATITVKAKDGSNQTATCEITVETAGTPVESILKEGNYVEYVDGTGETRNCVVLYGPENVNYSTYGIQIITMEKVEDVTLGDADSFIRSMNSYNGAITTLNSRAEAYLNPTYASNARSVGSVPDNPSDEPGMYKVIRDYMQDYDEEFKDEDSNYEIDFNQMEALGIQDINKTYWLASRTLESNLRRTYFCVRSVDTDGYTDILGATNTPKLCDIDEYRDEHSYSEESGLRPVFQLKSGIKVTGGEGTKLRPYTLGI